MSTMVDEFDITKRSADPFVAARVSDPGAKPLVTLTLAGLLGDSERDGYRRLYLTTSLDYFVDFRSDDVVSVEDVAAAQPPFVGLDATRVSLVPDAAVDWVRRSTASGSDPWLLQANERKLLAPFPETWAGGRCPGGTRFAESDFDQCGGTFDTVPSQVATCGRGTCDTCDRGTCVTCGRDTCVTCDGGTCVTCGQGTCATCGRGTCDRGCSPTDATCVSCAGTCDDTCATCWNTCAGTCVSCRATCDATCAATCADTCGTTCGPTCAVTCETCFTCNFFTCRNCQTDPGWCMVRR